LVLSISAVRSGVEIPRNLARALLNITARPCTVRIERTAAPVDDVGSRQGIVRWIGLRRDSVRMRSWHVWNSEY